MQIKLAEVNKFRIFTSVTTTTKTHKMKNTDYLTLCKEAINKRKAMLESKKQNIARQLTEGIYVQVKDGDKEFQKFVKKQEGSIVHLRGYRSPFTIEGDYLKRGKDLWLIEGQNGEK